MTKGWMIIVCIVIAVIGGAVAYYYHRQLVEATVLPPIHTAIVKHGTLSVHVYATGNVQANRTVDIKCQASGEITSLPFQIGDVVKKGQIVLKVDPTLEQQVVNISTHNWQQAKLNLNTAQISYQIAQDNLITSRQTDQANLLSAQAQVANDKLNLQRDATLLQEHLAAQQTYDNDETTLVKDQQTRRLAQVQILQLKQQALQVQVQGLNVKLDEVAVATAKSNLDQANTNLSYAQVKAPFTGLVANVDVQQGQLIASATTNVGGGTTVMTLVDISHIYINTTVNESDINHVKVGDKVQITAAGAPGVVFPGRVELMAPESIQDQGSSNASGATSNIVTFQVKIEVLGKNRRLLKPGMTANVNIFTDKLPDVLYIPLQAVMIEHNEDTVMVITPAGKRKLTTVTLGQRNDTDWQVLSGLTAGQKVLVHLSEVSRMWMPHH